MMMTTMMIDSLTHSLTKYEVYLFHLRVFSFKISSSRDNSFYSTHSKIVVIL